MSAHEENPTFGHHLKMLVICVVTAVVLAASVAFGFRQAYELVVWVGSRSLF